MKQKIEWYREVLEIEPNSKIFFPLARMLSKDGRPGEAIAVLRQGVGRHPDHIEARLFLVELLYSSEKIIELQQEVETLSVLFKNYPGFWRAWGEHLFGEDSTRDAGLAAIFMAAFLQNMPVSWAGIIEQGLKTFITDKAPRPVFMPEPHPEPSFTPSLSEEDLSLSPLSGFSSAPSFLQQERSASESLSMVSFDDDDEVEEPITLRTRSMAEVLAEQGDMAGALDIYNELLAAAGSDAAKKDLQARIDALSGNEVQVTGDDSQAPKEEKKDWLAILAQRLEARSLQ